MIAPPIRWRARTWWMQWICPACGDMHDHYPVNIRRARVTCTSCRMSWQVGFLGTTARPDVWPPYNARVGSLSQATANSLEALPEGIQWKPAIARVLGRIESQCPGCRWTSKCLLQRDVGRWTCPTCRKSFYVQIILRPWRRSTAWMTPFDWVMEHQVYVAQELDHLASPVETGEGLGADR